MKKILILWSGGIDSTAILKMYLEKTDYIVYAINIKLLSRSTIQRMHLEQESIDRVLPELLKIRDFKLIRTSVEMKNDINMSDAMFFGNFALPFAANNGIETITLGLIKDAKATPDYHDRMINALNDISDVHYKFHGRSRNWHFAPKFILPEFYNYKCEYIKEIGTLYDLTWSCRSPLLNKPCGHCTTCLEIKKSINNDLRTN